jgi:hypothetical protein
LKRINRRIKGGERLFRNHKGIIFVAIMKEDNKRRKKGAD